MITFALAIPKIAIATEQEMDAYWKIDNAGTLIIQPTVSEGFEKIVIEESDSVVWRGWPWEKVRGSITSITVKDGVMALEDSSKMFDNPYSCKTFNLSGLNTSNVVNMTYMLSGCPATFIDLSGFDTSRVNYMGGMFLDDWDLTSVNLSGFDTSHVTQMWGMFSGCQDLTSLDISGFDTSQVVNMRSMFSQCSSLTPLDLTGFDTSQVTDMSFMFCDCSSLVSLDLSAFDTSQVTDSYYMLEGCSSLVMLTIGPEWTLTFDEVNLPGEWRNVTTGTVQAKNTVPTAGTYIKVGSNVSITPGQISGSWVSSGGKWWYRYSDGSYPINRWTVINGAWYHFDNAGWMQTGWLRDGSNWYYLDTSGVMRTGWIKEKNTWYHLDESGAMHTGWLLDGLNWYYLDTNGAMRTGWYRVGNDWYYSNNSGIMQTDKWIGNYYVTSSGAMATNIWIGRYHVNASGLWDQTSSAQEQHVSWYVPL